MAPGFMVALAVSGFVHQTAAAGGILVSAGSAGMTAGPSMGVEAASFTVDLPGAATTSA
ncbi:MAG: hypothetical protein ACYCV4_01170 [Dermatophilaceae bacterium]